MKGDRYAEKRFTVPASAGKAETCARDGHAFADRKGRCIRCGHKIRHAATGWPNEAERRERRTIERDEHPHLNGVFKRDA